MSFSLDQRVRPANQPLSWRRMKSQMRDSSPEQLMMGLCILQQPQTPGLKRLKSVWRYIFHICR